MKKISILLFLFAAVLAGAQGQSSPPGVVSLASPAALQLPGASFLVGTVALGDLILLPSIGGNPGLLMRTGNLLLYRPNGSAATAVIFTERDRLPQFLVDDRGRVNGPFSITTSGEGSSSSMPRTPFLRPSPVGQAPSPIRRAPRPSNSSMPKSPFLRPSPRR